MGVKLFDANTVIHYTPNILNIVIFDELVYNICYTFSFLLGFCCANVNIKGNISVSLYDKRKYFSTIFANFDYEGDRS